METSIYTHRDASYQKIYFVGETDNIDKAIGFIDVFFESGVMIIGCIEVVPEYRNRGYGTSLIHYAINENKENITMVILEDESKNVKKENNIYLKLGFVYTTENIMELDITNYQLE